MCSWCNDEKARSARRRGVGILLVAVPLFTLMFVIFDLGRYAITMQSLRCARECGRPGGHDQLLRA